MADRPGMKGDVSGALALVLEDLADLVAERCAARLGVVAAPEYTSKHLPAGMSRRRFNDTCRRLAAQGDPRVKRRGRLWVAERTAIDEVPTRGARRANVVAGPWSPRAALTAAGVRPQRT